MSGGEAESAARAAAFAVWARAALGDYPRIASGDERRAPITGRDALALMQAAHMAGWIHGADYARRANGGEPR